VPRDKSRLPILARSLRKGGIPQTHAVGLFHGLHQKWRNGCKKPLPRTMCPHSDATTDGEMPPMNFGPATKPSDPANRTFQNDILKLLMFISVSLSPCVAIDWPPTLDKQNPVTRSSDGRTIERYIHGRQVSWGYPADNKEWDYSPSQESGPDQQNHNSFYVLSPGRPRDNAPLYVVLHSANRTAYDYLGFGALNRKIADNDDPATVMTNVPDDFYGLFLNSTNAEWWGWSHARQNLQAHIEAPPPAELRVLDTIEWVVKHYNIDRNRIYLGGISMGGNGTLGIGMSHGDIFAAMRVTVPAGTGYASYQWGGFAPSPAADASEQERNAWLLRASGAGHPDPPVIVDFSSPNDAWSVTQPALLQAAQAGHLPLVLAWGPFGHTGFGSVIAKSPVCEVAMAFPWLEIRKNEAYPVFTHASSDQQSPWLNAPADFDESGQINAYFRWKTVADLPSRFAIQLWIAHPPVQSVTMPDSVIADVTLRRLQEFQTQPGRTYEWHLSSAGHIIASGKIAPDKTNLLTIPRISLATAPTELSVEPSAQEQLH
jgi:hypothetical protein